ncbi:hypothetical protein FXN63_17985 [Pigmentiphaga aceris]|uniref:Uncharacterized protein n=1 Tax=Pigmentiphaga aceris TaxID=1940612 RepID=A0A5C0B4Q7_9BURK|nr:hypothetical protein [Pigmentiphaga aceris]QEI07517.1 hypothetical protein FXN63_17985 [Pigmentiphaga aceris]
MKPLWFLAAWLASSVFGAFVALEKNRCGLCWFAMGVLFGPLALITTVGLPVKLARPTAPPKPDAPVAHANAPFGHASPAHPPAAHAPHHAHPAAAHPASPAHPHHAPTAHPAVAQALQAAHPPAAAHHAEPVHTPPKMSFLESAMERPAAGIAVAAVVVVLLLLYFASRHL